jgi:hypothetical protein
MTAKMAAPTGPEIGNLPVSEAYRSRLADIVRRRGVKRVAYFHCDHFEPWRPAPGSKSIEQNAEDIVRFAESSAKNEFARKLTLFYKAHVPVTRNIDFVDAERTHPLDPFGFIERTPKQVAVFTSAIQELRARVPHEFQVHVHHEHFTSNSGHRDPELIKIFSDPAMAQYDEGRVEIAVKRSLAAIRQETGLPLDRWFFVHGVWALNASDSSVCNVTDEIALLMRNGALGDFTFPAGRPNVDPSQTEPFFVKPVNAPRGYDLAEAEPERAWGNPAAGANKFFIWASPIRHFGSSVDYFSIWLREKLETPAAFAEEILDQSVVVGETMWLKTHGHSMHANYWIEGQPLVFPHAYPPLQRLLGTVFDAATTAGAEIEFVSAADVYDRFVCAPEDDSVPLRLRSPFQIADGGSSQEIKQLADKINALSSTYINERVAVEGESAAGIGPYYAARAARGEVLAPYELRIAELLCRTKSLQIVFEIGSGLSALPMLLAAIGIKSVGVERDQSRVASARALLDLLAPKLDIKEELCEIWGSAAPGAIAHATGANAAIIFTNITSTISDDDLHELICQAAKFDLAIIDLARFFVVRDAAEQKRLLNRLVEYGWANPLPLTGSYWWFCRTHRESHEFEDESEELVT